MPSTFPPDQSSRQRLRRPPRRPRWTLLIFQPWSGGASGSLGGQLACLGAAGCYGVGYVYMARYLTLRGLTPLVLAAGQLALAALWLTPVLVVATGTVDLTPSVLGGARRLGPIGTGLAYVLNYDIVTREGATAASVVTLLGEHIGATALAGTAIVLAGVTLSRR